MATQPAPRQWANLIGQLIAGESLSAEDTRWAMDQTMTGEATAVQIAGLVVALRAKGETVDELAGFAAAMLDHATKLEVAGPLVDLVGTGGDRRNTVNLSTMGAVVAAAAGAPVVKHGNRAASSACGAADLLEQLGVVIDPPPEENARIAAELGIAFCFAPLYHPGFRHAAVPRRELGTPTVFNFLGPITNPADVRANAAGVSDARMAPIVAGVFADRGCEALVFRGDDGLDELTTTTTSTVYVVHGGEVAKTTFDPADLGFARSQVSDLTGGDPAYNAGVARDIFSGKGGPVRDTVLLNAAAALAVATPSEASLVERLRSGVAAAAEAIDSGAASDLLDRWAAATRAAAAS
ncbi:MAG: anthranilate phosphoribosyltransferase [Streptosporangiales bacterium]|nr:anthranilate phosphoribosyltransferase [Streptosporangiales bacterium]